MWYAPKKRKPVPARLSRELAVRLLDQRSEESETKLLRTFLDSQYSAIAGLKYDRIIKQILGDIPNAATSVSRRSQSLRPSSAKTSVAGIEAAGFASASEIRQSISCRMACDKGGSPSALMLSQILPTSSSRSSTGNRRISSGISN